MVSIVAPPVLVVEVLVVANEANVGLWLTGELRSVKPGRVWTGKDGTEHAPFLVRVLVGDNVLAVEYGSDEAAGSSLDGAEPGAMVSLAVGARAKGKDWLQFYGRDYA